MTGIDRVELAYLKHLAQGPDPFFAVARTQFGYVLLNAPGAQRMAEEFESGNGGPLDTLGHLTPHRPRPVRETEAYLRRMALARCLPQRLGNMLQRHLPPKTRYLNTGHANLTDRMLTALRRIDAQIAVLVHDVIPLEAPHWQRDGTVVRFQHFLRNVTQHADLVIYTADATRQRAEERMERTPRAIVAPLGVQSAAPRPLPDDVNVPSPYFVCLGTIEPRKNHTLLLDIWQDWGAAAPTLVLAGRRGWANAEVFKRLDAGMPQVIEAPDLDDGHIAQLLDGSHCLLFPSHLEGFGLPPMEAARRQVPVIAQPLPVLRELMGSVPTFIDGNRPDVWRAEIAAMAATRRTPPPFDAPTWDAHFNAVLRMT